MTQTSKEIRDKLELLRAEVVIKPDSHHKILSDEFSERLWISIDNVENFRGFLILLISKYGISRDKFIIEIDDLIDKILLEEKCN